MQKDQWAEIKTHLSTQRTFPRQGEETKDLSLFGTTRPAWVEMDTHSSVKTCLIYAYRRNYKLTCSLLVLGVRQHCSEQIYGEV